MQFPDEEIQAAIRKFVQEHQGDAPARILLRYHGKVPFDLTFAVQQIQARQKAKNKLPSWCAHPDLLFPPNLSLEQASSEETAAYKCSLVSDGLRMGDLTGGLGVDFWALTAQFQEGHYFEQNSELLQLAQHNFKHLRPEKKLHFHAGDSLKALNQFPDKHFDLLFIDPARRGSQAEKVFRLEDCSPDVATHWPLLRQKSRQLLLKLSPMLDIQQLLRQLPELQKICIISVKNEVKELLAYFSDRPQATASEARVTFETVELQQEGLLRFLCTEQDWKQEAPLTETIGSYLVLPGAGVMKLGAFAAFSRQTGLKKLHGNTHLFSAEVSDLPTLSEIPCRIFALQSEIHQPKKELKKIFPSGKVNVIAKNHPLTAAGWKEKFKLKDGSEDYLIAAKTLSGDRVWHARLHPKK
ncbi:MAG: THUMP-like domain-containing protein [Nitritalea sp.]